MKVQASKIPNLNNLSSNDIVNYMLDNNISIIVSGNLEYGIEDIEDSIDYIKKKENEIARIERTFSKN